MCFAKRLFLWTGFFPRHFSAIGFLALRKKKKTIDQCFRFDTGQDKDFSAVRIKQKKKKKRKLVDIIATYTS